MSHLYENIEKCLPLIFNVKAVVALEDPGVNKFDFLKIFFDMEQVL